VVVIDEDQRINASSRENLFNCGEGGGGGVGEKIIARTTT